jgi:hypothetical protein
MDMPRAGFNQDDAIPGAEDRRITIRRRHALGRAHFGEVLGWWFARGSLSHSRLLQICEWVSGEAGLIGSSQISHLRNAAIRNPNWLLIEGVCNVNLGIHKWQIEGPKSCFKAYGPFGKGIDGESALNEAIWLPMPNADVPLQFHDWCNLFTGRLMLSYVDEVIVSPSDSSRLNEELAKLLEEVIEGQGLGFRRGMAELLRAYPVTDDTRRQRLRSLILGESTMLGDEIQQELASIAAAIEIIRELEPGSYGPQQLWRELTSNRKRT